MSRISELFEWLSGTEVQITLENSLILEEEISADLNRVELLLEELSTENPLPPEIDLKSTEQAEGSKKEALEYEQKKNKFVEYIYFLGFCLRRSSDKTSQYSLAIQYMLEQKKGSRANEIRSGFKTTNLFKALYSSNKEEAINLYNENKDSLKRFPMAVTFMESNEHEEETVDDASTVGEILNLFKDKLKHQEKPKRIIPLLKNYFEEPKKLAALLLWLLEEGVSSEKIIQSSILHEFFIYGYTAINTERDLIQQLYLTLKPFEQAKELIKLASETSSESRGLERLSLTAALHEEKNGLVSVSPKAKLVQFTLSEESFRSLYELFGDIFLIQALIWFQKTQLEELGSLLSRWFNKEKEQFSFNPWTSKMVEFSNLVVKSKMLEPFSNILDDETILHLSKFPESQIISILLYKPKLARMIDETALQLYFDEICFEANLSDIENQSHILELLGVLNDNNMYAAEDLLISTTLEAFLNKPALYESGEFTEYFKYFLDNELLTRKEELISQEFKERIEAYTSSEVSQEVYQMIEETWREGGEKIELLELLGLEEPGYPMDECSFFRAVLVTYHQNNTNLADFIKNLNLTAKQLEDIKLERVLIYMLIVFDHDELRNEIIGILESDIINNPMWMIAEYDNDSVLYSAAAFGNIGLVSHLLLTYTPYFDSVHIRKCLVEAADHKQWDIVRFLCTQEIPPLTLDQETIDNVFEYTCLIPEFELISFFARFPGCVRPSKPSVLKIYKYALRQELDNTITHLVSLRELYPVQEVVDTLFEDAAAGGHLNLLEKIPLLFKMSVSQNVLDSALNKAVTNKQWEIVGLLIGFMSPKPTQQVIDNAFFALANANRLDLLNSVVDGISDDVINKGFLKAAEGGQWECLKNINALCHKRLKNNVINTVLKIGHKTYKGQIVDLIFRNFNEAVNESVKIGQMNRVKFLLNEMKPLELDIDLVLYGALRTKEWELVKYLSSHPKLRPSPESLDYVSTRARILGQHSVEAWIKNSAAPLAYHQFNLEEDAPLTRIRNLLNDYTKSDSVVNRFFHGHWNRHHVKQVAAIVQDIDCLDGYELNTVLEDLDKIALINPTGSLARRIQFIKTKIVADEAMELLSLSPT